MPFLVPSQWFNTSRHRRVRTLLTRGAERISKSGISVSSDRIRTSNLLVYSAPRLAERSASQAFGSFSGGTATRPSKIAISPVEIPRVGGDHAEKSRLRDNEIVVPQA